MRVSLTSSLSIGRSDDDIMICLTDHREVSQTYYLCILLFVFSILKRCDVWGRWHLALNIGRIQVRRENNVLNGLWMDTVLFNYRNLEVFVDAVPIRI